MPGNKKMTKAEYIEAVTGYINSKKGNFNKTDTANQFEEIVMGALSESLKDFDDDDKLVTGRTVDIKRYVAAMVNAAFPGITDFENTTQLGGHGIDDLSEEQINTASQELTKSFRAQVKRQKAVKKDIDKVDEPKVSKDNDGDDGQAKGGAGSKSRSKERSSSVSSVCSLS